ncbi:MAG: DUF502 domain-containing protein [Syntrophobacteria bacterium]
MRKFILTTVLGGVLFLIPFVLVVVLLGKGFMIMRTIAEKVNMFLPLDSVAGLPIVDVLAVLFLISCCFIAGLVARSSWARDLRNRIDDLLLQLVPGYAWIKGMTGSVSKEEAAAGFKPVWIRLDDQYQVGFEVERCEGDLVAVFLPGAPDPRTGTLSYVESDRIEDLDSSFNDVSKNFRRLGMGSAAKISQSKIPTQASA